jgi:4-amino-4-deoxy-L-arabinose transferase-like glycosyltransferase
VSTPLLSPALLLLFAALLLVHLLATNAWVSVWDEDEAAYAGFARRMAVDGDWLVPEFPYSKAHRKMPGFLWIVAAGFEAFGVNAFVLRLPGVLATLLTALCVWRGASFLLGADAARLGALILLTGLLVGNICKVAVTDSVLMLFQTIAALALLRAAVRPSFAMTAILWAAVAAGVLVKGPPILITVGAIFLFLLAFHRRRRNLVHLHPWIGLPLALLPAAVWIWLVWKQDAFYVLFLAYHHVLRRFAGSFFDQAGPPGTHFVLILFFLLPWTAFLLPALWDAWRNLRRRRTAFVLLGAWLFGGWIIWELPSSKLPTYVMGAYPALALLLARQVRFALDGRISWASHATLRVSFHTLLVASALMAVGTGAAVIWLGAWWAKAAAILPVAAFAGMAFAATRWQKQARPRAAVRTLLFGSLLASLATWGVAVGGIEHRRAVMRHVAETIAARRPPGTEVVVATFERPPSLAFYLEQNGVPFRDVLQPPPEPREVVVDWGLLWEGRLRELIEQVRSQRPPQISKEEEQDLVLARVRELLAEHTPRTLLLDERQVESLNDALGDAEVVCLSGWRSDRARFVRICIVMSQVAKRPAE